MELLTWTTNVDINKTLIQKQSCCPLWPFMKVLGGDTLCHY